MDLYAHLTCGRLSIVRSSTNQQQIPLWQEYHSVTVNSESFSPTFIKVEADDRHMLACFGMDENKVLILDMRSPGQPVAELVGHQAPLSGIAWGSGGNGSSTTGGGWIASCGIFCPQALK